VDVSKIAQSRIDMMLYGTFAQTEQSAMTELGAGAKTHVVSRFDRWPFFLRAAVILLFSGLLFFSLIKVPDQQPMYHIGFSEHWRGMIFVPVCLTIAIGSAFVFANFGFGYFAGFYLFTMMAGYFWLNTFSVLTYDHTEALISVGASITLFLLPSLMIRAPTWTFPIPGRLFDRIPEAILCFAAIVLLACAWSGFHFIGLDGMAQYRNELAQGHSRAVEYAIGNLNGALTPFAFACFLVRKRWLMLAALCVVSLLYYPATLTKVSLFVAPFLIFMAVLSKLFEARACVIISLLVPLIIGLSALAGLDWDRRIIFSLLNIRLLAIPSISLEHYFAFFSDHPLTGFCQISLLKPFVACPYSEQLGTVLADQYHLGNMNASLFATEGVASVGPVFAPLSALACVLVIALGNKVSAGLPPRFVLISAAIIPHILLNVSLSTTLLSNGLGLLMLLWFLTPRDYFSEDLAAAADDQSLVRRILASPVYFVAFAFHLLCAGLTLLAAKIAGDPN
jgi:hypothetical protein